MFFRERLTPLRDLEGARRRVATKLGAGISGAKPSMESIARGIREGKFKNIVVLAGAGISVSAGIDFRSPKTGLYHNLKEYNLPTPESIFDIGFFKRNPKPFFRLALELYPGRYDPTPTHYFFKLLHEKGVLRRVFTQNIDTLEQVAGLPESKCIAAHGNFATSTCRGCGRVYSQDWMEKKLFEAEGGEDVPVPKCESCDSVVKPDITFFGEDLPERFGRNVKPDTGKADLLLVMGTSLQVYPVAGIVDMVRDDCPRILFNRDPVHLAEKVKLRKRGECIETGFTFRLDENYRDVFVQGDCDDGVKEFVDLIGWRDDFDRIVKAGASECANGDNADDAIDALAEKVKGDLKL